MVREQYPGEGKAVHLRSSRASERFIASRQYLSSARYTTRLHRCTCFECLDGNYEGCKNSAMVDGWQEARLTRDGEVTRQRSEAAGGDRVNALTDLIEGNSIVAKPAEEDNHFDNYLLKVVSSGAVVLELHETDDYGIAYPMGSFVLKGSSFYKTILLMLLISLTQRLPWFTQTQSGQSVVNLEP